MLILSGNESFRLTNMKRKLIIQNTLDDNKHTNVTSFYRILYTLQIQFIYNIIARLFFSNA